MTDRTQELMNQAYSRWQANHWSQEDFWVQLSPKERVAVFVGNLNYQVENGGFSQWHFNGYSDCAGELSQILPKLGETGEKVAGIVRRALREIEAHEDDDDDWDYSEDYDLKFYAINTALLEECEAFISLPDEEFLQRMKGFRYSVTL